MPHPLPVAIATGVQTVTQYVAKAWGQQVALWKKRHADIIHWRERDDLAFSAIAEKLGVSRQRAAQLYRSAKNAQVRDAAKGRK